MILLQISVNNYHKGQTLWTTNIILIFLFSQQLSGAERTEPKIVLCLDDGVDDLDDNPVLQRDAEYSRWHHVARHPQLPVRQVEFLALK